MIFQPMHPESNQRKKQKKYRQYIFQKKREERNNLKRLVQQEKSMFMNMSTTNLKTSTRKISQIKLKNILKFMNIQVGI